jgi:hypothetical protein
MTIHRLILNMRRRYGDTTLFLFRGFVYLVKRNIISHALHPHVLGYRRRQGGLAMIYMTYGTHIYMRLGPLKLFLPHLLVLPWIF